MHRQRKEVILGMYEKRGIIITLLILACFIIAVIPAPAAGEPSNNALTRGSRFTVNITGLPSTPYYVWLTRTSTMTGNPGDQPPVFVPFQSGIQQDPPEGPYTIGSYVINNGNGRTIRDDVAPSTPELSNTNYYALVTTGTDGRAVIAFQTSSGTATKTFSIKVENAQSAANSDIFIERGLPSGFPTTTFPESTVITPELTTIPAVTRAESTIPVTLVSTTVPGTILTLPRQSASGQVYYIIAIVTGLLVWSKKDILL
jgi:hypothetical protein